MRPMPRIGFIDGLISAVNSDAHALGLIRDAVSDAILAGYNETRERTRLRVLEKKNGKIPLWLICLTCGFDLVPTLTIKQTLLAIREFVFGPPQGTDPDLVDRMSEIYFHLDGHFTRYLLMVKKALPIMMIAPRCSSGIGLNRDELDELKWPGLYKNRFASELSLAKDRLDAEQLVRNMMREISLNDSVPEFTDNDLKLQLAPAASRALEWGKEKCFALSDEIVTNAVSRAILRVAAFENQQKLPARQKLSMFYRARAGKIFAMRLEAVDSLMDTFLHGARSPLGYCDRGYAKEMLRDFVEVLRKNNNTGSGRNIRPTIAELERPDFLSNNAVEASVVPEGSSSIVALVERAQIYNIMARISLQVGQSESEGMENAVIKDLLEEHIMPYWGNRHIQTAVAHVRSRMKELRHTALQVLPNAVDMMFAGVDLGSGAFARKARIAVNKLRSHLSPDSDEAPMANANDVSKLRDCLVSFEEADSLDDYRRADLKRDGLSRQFAEVAEVWANYTWIRIEGRSQLKVGYGYTTQSGRPEPETAAGACVATGISLRRLRDSISSDLETMLCERTTQGFLEDEGRIAAASSTTGRLGLEIGSGLLQVHTIASLRLPNAFQGAVSGLAESISSGRSRLETEIKNGMEAIHGGVRVPNEASISPDAIEWYTALSKVLIPSFRVSGAPNGEHVPISLFINSSIADKKAALLSLLARIKKERIDSDWKTPEFAGSEETETTNTGKWGAWQRVSIEFSSAIRLAACVRLENTLRTELGHGGPFTVDRISELCMMLFELRLLSIP